MYILKSHQYSDNDNCIEVLGMPASGKSTLVQKMIEESKEIININDHLPKSNIRRQMYKLKSTLSCFITSPLMFIQDWKIIASSGQKNIRDFLAVLSNWFLIIYMYNQSIKNKEHIFIWDQGLFQALWSINFTSSRNFDMQLLLERKILPKVVYFTDTDDEVLIERALNRNTPIRLEYRNKEHIQNGRRALQHVLELMEKIGYTKE